MSSSEDLYSDSNEEEYYKKKWEAFFERSETKKDISRKVEQICRSMYEKLEHTEASVLSQSITDSSLRYAKQRVFNASGGTGYAAEHTNHLNDFLKGKKATLLNENKKNGADRISEGIFIQCKYYSSARSTVNAAFSGDKFKYAGMKIEVPSDQYIQSVDIMKKRIKDGHVPGVSNIDSAEKIIKKGSCTYAQAKNIARFGNFDSLKFDIKNGVISSKSSIGISALISFATAKRSGATTKEALSTSLHESLKTGLDSAAIYTYSSQLGRTSLDKMLKPGSDFIVRSLPKSAIRSLNLGLKSKSLNSVPLLSSSMRGIGISLAASTIIRRSFADSIDLYNGRMSANQFFKNSSSDLASGAGSSIAFFALAGITTAINPILGWAIRIGGSCLAGNLIGKGVEALFSEDDAKRMGIEFTNSLEELSSEYLLEDFEVSAISEIFSEKIEIKEFFMNMHASSDKKEYSKDKLEPMVKALCGVRPPILLAEVSNNPQ